jgi:hypothetical protein
MVVGSRSTVIGHIRPCRAQSSFFDQRCYSLASAIGTWDGITPPEICDAIRNAATTAGTLINLRN